MDVISLLCTHSAKHYLKTLVLIKCVLHSVNQVGLKISFKGSVCQYLLSKINKSPGLWSLFFKSDLFSGYTHCIGIMVPNRKSSARVIRFKN